MFPARVKAILGPTNTGKTHLAITRMLAHSSGIIGFPLRLLARENYDRMVAAKGARYVALITGEEKILPPEARWFACTVEAMPLDRRAEFVAVDEIQLCADPDRGHIFTDRLLNARGLVETMFLGAETIRPLLQRLVPQAEIETRPRLSQLSYAGPAKLTRLPPRSAVVAFSAGEVYAIAEAIRRRRGGCAVVMGRLSPRTRNAQVALYQNREVDFLVATDAIGMGLNMDVDHVAFASLNKFDGHRPRILTPQEAAQIAGRAGRGMRDGSFGVTGDCPPLPDEMVDKIEGHQFEALQQLAWRNADLDFSGIDALLDSLALPPRQPGLSRGNDATDYVTLEALSRDPEVRKLADHRNRVRLLWEACQVPDFRKLADDSHTKFAAKIFIHMVKDGALPTDWVASQIAQLGNIEGDLDTLMSRLSAIRVWTYVAARADWVRDATRFQSEARAAEDAVSDALHERLTARFVDRRAAHLIRRLDETEEELLSAVNRKGEVVVEGHPVGHVSGFVFEPDPSAANEDERKLVLRAARRALVTEMPRRVAALEAAKDEDFALTPTHRITWDGADIARLKPGPTPDKPQVEPLASEFLDGAQKERLRVRLAAWLEAMLAREFAALNTVEEKAAEDNTLRGPAFRLREYLGLVPGGTEAEVNPELRQKLKAIGIRAGRFALYLPEVLKPRPMALRAQLWALKAECMVPALPGGGLVSVPPPEGWPAGFAETMGWVPAGPVLLRLDVAERVAGELGHLTRRHPAMLPPDVASRLGVKADALPVVLNTLGFRLLPVEPAAEGAFGPPSPQMVAVKRDENRHRGPRQGRPPQRDRRPAPAVAAAAEGATAEAAPEGAEAATPRPERAPRPPRRDDRSRGPRPPRPEGQDARAPRPEGARPEGTRPEFRDRPRPPRDDRGRDDRPRGPRPFDKNNRGGGSEGRSYSFDAPKPAKADPDSPFAVLSKLKLGKG
ncbi:helicase-related protein [Roseomonas haemaphysalidis]|uniref:DNA helicase n=1 Tax=Roseomonas haemaphysalidis TaxID=2768162 RepID=A0ABS3KPJ1_9PROT|nr:helicase-related protein [Roseomonas haemaphysalidis]MBO1078932.1 DNA helicase [Roseomonas haemaphysalidis]